MNEFIFDVNANRFVHFWHLLNAIEICMKFKRYQPAWPADKFGTLIDSEVVLS